MVENLRITIYELRVLRGRFAEVIYRYGEPFVNRNS